MDTLMMMFPAASDNNDEVLQRILAPSTSSTTTSTCSSSTSSSAPDVVQLQPPMLSRHRFRTTGSRSLLALIVTTMFALVALAPQRSAAMPNEWEEQRMCGRLLIQALKTVCNHQYAQPNRDNFYETAGVLRARRSPRAPRASYVVKRRRQLLAADPFSGSVSMSSGSASGSGMGRSRRGIIWECCTNKCSLNYIRNNYCAAAQADAPAPPGPAFQLVDDDDKRRR